MAPHSLELGRQGEAAAREYLRQKGYKILDANWQTRKGELDIICSRKKWIIFVEVRTRAEYGMTDPMETVTGNKQRRIVTAAREYLSKNGLWGKPCRFDLVSVLWSAGSLHLQHEEDVFDVSHALDSRHSSWQPW